MRRSATLLSSWLRPPRPVTCQTVMPRRRASLGSSWRAGPFLAVAVLFYVSNWILSKADTEAWTHYINEKVQQGRPR